MLPVNWNKLTKEQVTHLRKYSPQLYFGYCRLLAALADKREQERAKAENRDQG